MMKAAEIRQQFLDFFKEKGHTIVPSAPIVVKNDPTLMFTNAGMNQFKDYFLGNKSAPFNRAVDTQKCLRVSGKHNDLEEVGVDTYHHTMFEMLGNWSFGDPNNAAAGYFKKEAINWSWELLADIYKIPADRLYATVFEGDEKEGLPFDEESAGYWKNLMGAEADIRIIMGNKKDNFWEMGDTGPCGPCTEVHVDMRSDEEREKIPGHELVNKDHPQVIEIWNNVFIQFNRKKDGTLEPLPAKHVDTGMGLERLVRVMQGKSSNYDTDIFSGTIAETENISGKKYSGGDDKESIAFRVIADHIRAVSFTIADGQLPSNTGAGYVIRRILRRAVRYYYSYLDYKQPLLCRLVPVLAKQFETVFPELHQQVDFVTKVVKEEEDAFLRTIAKGMEIINAIIEVYNGDYYSFINEPPYVRIKKNLPSILDELVKSSNSSMALFSSNDKHSLQAVGGSICFILSDRHGFPLDLTRLIFSENGIGIDEAGFDVEMKKQKDRSRAATALDTEDWIELQHAAKNTFCGYTQLETQTSVVKYRTVKGKGKTAYQLVLAETPFYAESGGQVGDTGQLTIGSNTIDIYDTKKENDLIIHFAEQIPGELTGAVTATVHGSRRKAICVHHSVTHLMHSALRSVLGTHVAQKGSLVNDEYLRFDFSHFSKVTDEELNKVEMLVNEKIRENIPVVIKEMPKDEAMKLGAMALFGEKYGDTVRVVVIDPSYSVELCGGTHVGSTGEMGLFKITSESAVAASVRRVEAVCGKAAETYISTQLQQLENIKQQFKNPKDLLKATESLQQENASLKKHIESLEARQLVVIRNELLHKDEIINGVTFIGEIIEVSNADALKKLCFDLKNHLHDYVAVLCANIGGKPFVAVGIAETVAAAKNMDAGKLIKEVVAPLIKGGGGGQKTLATAGGQEVAGLTLVIEKIKETVQQA